MKKELIKEEEKQRERRKKRKRRGKERKERKKEKKPLYIRQVLMGEFRRRSFTNKKKTFYSPGQQAWCVFPVYFMYISQISMLPMEWYHHINIASSSTVSVWLLQHTSVSHEMLDLSASNLPVIQSHLKVERVGTLLTWKGICRPSFSVLCVTWIPKPRKQKQGGLMIIWVWIMLLTPSRYWTFPVDVSKWIALKATEIKKIVEHLT